MTRSDLIARLVEHFPHLVQKDAQVATEVILDPIVHPGAWSGRLELNPTRGGGVAASEGTYQGLAGELTIHN